MKTRTGTTGRYAVATFSNDGPLDSGAFNRILALRQEYIHFIRPQDPVATSATTEDLTDAGETLVDTDDDLPF
jgi:hypothetical protein